MIRALVALLMTCLLAVGFVVHPDLSVTSPSSERVLAVLVFYGLIAIPGFLFLATTRAVQWWHMLVASLLAAALYLIFSGRFSVIYGPSYALSLFVRCAVASSLFWIAGVWRNPRFPDATSAMPVKSFVLIGPVIVVAAIGFVWLAPAKLYGHVADSGSLDTLGNRIVHVRLSDGQNIQAVMMFTGARVPSTLSCVEMNTRHGFDSPAWRRYWIENTFECDSRARADLRVGMR